MKILIATCLTCMVLTGCGKRDVGSAAPGAPEAGPQSAASTTQPDEGGAQGLAAVETASNASEFVNSLGMRLKLISAGSFLMGSEKGDSDERPVHNVRITRPFYLGLHEVTQADYEAVAGSNPSSVKDPRFPVESVSWDDAVKFCEVLTEQERSAGRLPVGHEYRLPTEAQWEYACRAGSTSEYSFGDDEAELDAFAWFSGNSDSGPQEGGTKKPNAWGLYDMHGSVWEWCADSYGDYPAGDVADPVTTSGSGRVTRGGSRGNRALNCRSAYRSRGRPSFTHNSLGFRVALVSVP